MALQAGYVLAKSLAKQTRKPEARQHEFLICVLFGHPLALTCADSLASHFFPAVHQATPQGPSTFPHTAGVLADLVPRTKSASRGDGPPGPEPERFRLSVSLMPSNLNGFPLALHTV